MKRKICDIVLNNPVMRFWNAPVKPVCGVWWQVGGFFGVLAVLALITIIFDPVFRYHKPEFYKVVYMEPYDQIPGILRHCEYDTLILGASNSENYFISDVEKVFPGAKAIKATSAGASLAVQRRFFEIALAEKGDRLKRVIQTIETESFLRPWDSLNTVLPEFFYSEEYWHDYGYWWNIDVLTTHGKNVFSSFFRPRKVAQEQKYDEMFNRYSAERRFGLKSILEKHKLLTSWDFPADFKNNIVPNIENNCEVLVKANPGVEFIYVFPPYSIFFYTRFIKHGDPAALAECRRMMVKKLAKYPNVKIYDFQNQPELICNFAMYRDPFHYRPSQNREIIKQLANEKWVLRSVAEADRNSAALLEQGKRFIEQHPEMEL